MNTIPPDRPSSKVRAPYQWLALVIGVAYLGVGIVGFAITGFDGFAEHDHSQTLLGFAVNPLHNIVHLIVGLAGVVLWSAARRARLYGMILLVGYGAAFVYGLFAVNMESINVLNINAADNVLHAVSALLGLLIVLSPKHSPGTTTRGLAERDVDGTAPAP